MICSRLTVLALALTLALLVGCGSEEPAASPSPPAKDMVSMSPEVMRMVLAGLKSNDPRVRYASLDKLSRFPEVARTYREHVEQIQKEGKDERVRKKAAELIATLDQ